MMTKKISIQQYNAKGAATQISNFLLFEKVKAGDFMLAHIKNKAEYANGWAGAVMRKPRAFTKIRRTDLRTDFRACGRRTDGLTRQGVESRLKRRDAQEKLVPVGNEFNHISFH